MEFVNTQARRPKASTLLLSWLGRSLAVGLLVAIRHREGRFAHPFLLGLGGSGVGASLKL